MTAVVGILCSDGIVIGTDSSMTMVAGTFRTIEQSTEKLDVVGDRIIIAGTGSVGHGQRFRNVVDKAWRSRQFVAERDGERQTPVDICRDLSRATISDFAETNTSGNAYGALLAVAVGQEPILCEFATNGFEPTLYTDKMWFCSMGSTQPITDPFLALMREIFWPDSQPTVSHAALAATWALDHAIAVNPGGVNGPARIAVLERHQGAFRARLLTDLEMGEHRAWIDGAKQAMAETLPAVNGPDVPRVQPQTARSRR